MYLPGKYTRNYVIIAIALSDDRCFQSGTKCLQQQFFFASAAVVG